MAPARNSSRAASLQSGVPVVVGSSRYSRIEVRICDRVVMGSTLATVTSESNGVIGFYYFFEISTGRQGRAVADGQREALLCRGWTMGGPAGRGSLAAHKRGRPDKEGDSCGGMATIGEYR